MTGTDLVSALARRPSVKPIAYGCDFGAGSELVNCENKAAVKDCMCCRCILQLPELQNACILLATLHLKERRLCLTCLFIDDRDGQIRTESVGAILRLLVQIVGAKRNPYWITERSDVAQVGLRKYRRQSIYIGELTSGTPFQPAGKGVVDRVLRSNG